MVDNLPHATFKGKDAQLDAAVRHLLAEIRKHPVEVPKAPRYPDKSFRPDKEGQRAGAVEPQKPGTRPEGR